MPVIPPVWKVSGGTIDLGEPLGAGIVNVTTDSMFSGARSGTPEQAVLDGKRLVEAGFGMLDVGAIAARSGPPVGAEDEAAALVPAVEALAAPGTPVSADTFSPEVAARALDAGAVVVNDIGGGGEAMFDLVATTGCGYVLMHIEGSPRVDRPVPVYGDVVEHLKRWFGERIDLAVARGVAEEQIVIDPGLDFDLDAGHGLEILRRLEELTELGRPLYVSLSRKDLIGALLAGSWEGRWEAGDREWGTVAAATLAIASGASILRLHDPSALQAMGVATAIRGGG